MCTLNDPLKDEIARKSLELAKFEKIHLQPISCEIKTLFPVFDTQLMKDRQIILNTDTIEDVFNRVIKGFLEVEKAHSWNDQDPLDTKNLYSLLNKKILVLGTQILTNVNRGSRPTCACAVVPIDLKSNLTQIKKRIIPYYQNGIGTGFDLNDAINPLETLCTLNQIALDLEKEKLRRPIANMGILRIDHPMIFEFIRFKRNVNFYKWRFNLSVAVTDDFMKAVKNDEEWFLKNSNGKIIEKLKARKIFDEIVKSTHYCGEPGIIFWDKFQEDNPTPEIKYASLAPCAEVALASGEVCQFSYINLSKLLKKDKNGNLFFDFSLLEKTVQLLVRILDDSMQITIENSLDNSSIIEKKRRIGIGVCGVADMFIKLGIPYEDPKAAFLMEKIMSAINFFSKSASNDLAVSRGAFPAFNQSRYMDPNWFLTRRFTQETKIISKSMWHELYEKIQNTGLRNCGTCALPPTGVSSRIVLTSNSIEPRFSLKIQFGAIPKHIRKKITQELTKEWYPTHYINIIIQKIQENGLIKDLEKLPPFLKSLLKVNYQVHYQAQMSLMEKIAKYADESVSKTINLPKSSSLDDIYKIFMSANDMGLKGITVFRDHCLDERKIEKLEE